MRCARANALLVVAIRVTGPAGLEAVNLKLVVPAILLTIFVLL